MKPANRADSELSGQLLLDIGTDNVIAADLAVHRGHQEQIERAIDALIRSGATFTADDVHRHLGDSFRPHHHNLYGATIRAYRRRGLIKAVGWCESGRPSRHCGVLRVWRGVIGGEAA